MSFFDLSTFNWDLSREVVVRVVPELWGAVDPSDPRMGVGRRRRLAEIMKTALLIGVWPNPPTRCSFDQKLKLKLTTVAWT